MCISDITMKYQCSECARTGDHASVLEHFLDRHLSSRHVPYMCSHCPKRPRFATYDAAKRHCNVRHDKRRVKDVMTGTFKSPSKTTKWLREVRPPTAGDITKVLKANSEKRQQVMAVIEPPKKRRKTVKSVAIVPTSASSSSDEDDQPAVERTVVARTEHSPPPATPGRSDASADPISPPLTPGHSDDLELEPEHNIEIQEVRPVVTPSCVGTTQTDTAPTSAVALQTEAAVLTEAGQQTETVDMSEASQQTEVVTSSPEASSMVAAVNAMTEAQRGMTAMMGQVASTLAQLKTSLDCNNSRLERQYSLFNKLGTSIARLESKLTDEATTARAVVRSLVDHAQAMGLHQPRALFPANGRRESGGHPGKENSK